MSMSIDELVEKAKNDPMIKATIEKDGKIIDIKKDIKMIKLKK